ncbi:TIGR02569 family protein [Amycolatopsis xylanica]|uniref:TIGR02569 family protein n=1 Tax=Amycolatopsis xylanica TaxID=589385 RepID=A0A1H3SLX5_9PSEU|nr:TIGR02569 family protein [Amycolatopsis xylanica]
MAVVVRHQSPPEHVCSAFGAHPAELEPLPGGTVWRCGDIVVKPVADKSRAVWSARALEQIDAPGLRIARPVRASDGRWIVAGWAANKYVPGTPEHRADETVLAAVKLHQATARLSRPSFLATRDDPEGIADRVAWGELEVPLEETRGGRWFEVLAGARRPVKLPDQVVHGDLLASVVYSGKAAPGIVDFVPYYRPAEWGAAVVAVDAIAWGGADIQLLHRWAHLPEWPQLLLRAILFRLAAHALNPRSTRAALDGLRAAAREVSELV